MKRILAITTAAVASITLMAGVASAAPVAPAECTATYTKTVTVPAGGYYSGTAANELIFAGQGSYVLGNGGSDCIVINGYGALAQGGAGRDVIIDNAGGSSLQGEAANDRLISRVGGSSLNGGTGVDTCEGDYRRDSFKSCEQ